MAQIDPADTTEVPAAVAIDAATVAPPPAPARPAPRQITQGPAVPAAAAAPFATAASPTGGLDDASLVRVLQALGYGGDSGPQLAEPDPLEGNHIQLVSTGWARFPSPFPPAPDTPTLLRLRRPLLGALRRIRIAHEDLNGEIDQAKVQYQTAKRAHEARAEQAKALDEPEKSTVLLASKRQFRQADRLLQDTRDRLLVEWWTLVFGILCPDAPWSHSAIDPTAPEGWEWDSWAIDEPLTVRLLNHWRSVPLAPGR